MTVSVLSDQKGIDRSGDFIRNNSIFNAILAPHETNLIFKTTVIPAGLLEEKIMFISAQICFETYKNYSVYVATTRVVFMYFSGKR